jgi:hypothetical protein
MTTEHFSAEHRAAFEHYRKNGMSVRGLSDDDLAALDEDAEFRADTNAERARKLAAATAPPPTDAPRVTTGRSLTHADLADVVRGMGPPLREFITAHVRAEVARALDSRRATPGVQWMGVYAPGTTYRCCNLVTARGLWLCVATETVRAPGTNSDWRLVCKENISGDFRGDADLRARVRALEQRVGELSRKR